MTADQLTATHSSSRRGSRVELLVRLLVVLGLAVDAAVHLRMAPVMDLAAPGGIGGGTLFRLQGGLAAVSAVVLLLTGRRWAYVLALLVALSALGPVLLYHLVDVPAIGPIPSMHDPLWSPEKVVSIVGQTLAVVLSLVGRSLVSARGGTPRDRRRR